jgi:3'(2'), 5'-bisphosphate nucleotidase
VTDERDDLARRFAEVCCLAGQVVMEVYATDFEARAKADSSPVTEADERAEALILPALAALLPGVAVVAEEAVSAGGLPFGDGPVPSEFLLVDPLDGTREFLGRNGDFTVNVALVRDGAPVAGAVYAPARSRLFLGGTTASVGDVEPGAPLPALRPLRTRAYPDAGLVAVASKSHLDADTAAFLERLAPADTRSAGSSLKLCLVAAGEADVYPRFGPTMEWDIAAGDAVLRAAGGQLLDPDGAVFRYGKADSGLRNGPFVAWGSHRLL